MKKKLNLHYIILGAVALIAIIAIVRLIIWNISAEDISEIEQDDSDYYIESMDYILPLNPKYLEGREDDGVTTMVCLGNAPFADDRNSESNLAKLIEKELGENAKVYNCSVADSYMSSMAPTFTDTYPYDAFSFYWLTTVIALEYDVIIDTAFAGLEEVPADLQESMDLLRSIDFETVDVITVMYDASDYLDGRMVIDTDNPMDIQRFTGALASGIQLIQEYYPHIRIMGMSPTYAYAIDENGEYQSSDIVDYGMGPLSTYAILESDVCYENSVSFVDNIYATINEDNASEYLIDNLHINEKGREIVAKHFVECFNMYKGIKAENAD